MSWKLEDAQKNFPALLEATRQEPQLIYDHDELIAAIIQPDIFQQFLEWKKKSSQHSLADTFAELRQICIEENYSFEIPERS